MLNLNEKSYVGIDISKEKLDVYILPNHKYLQFANNCNGIKKLITKLQFFPNALIAIEATGGYEKQSAEALTKANLQACVLNPRQVRDFAKGLGKLAKTDKIDAEMLALFAEKVQPKPNVNCDENQRIIAEYVDRRSQLIKTINMEKNRLENVSKEIKKSIIRVIKMLEKELEKIILVQKKLIQENVTYSQKDKILQSIKGVGVAVSSEIIANLPELGVLGRRQITALVGLAPINHDSGRMKGKRAIRGGRISVRCMLYMATISGIRYNPKIKEFYQRLRATGKLPKVAITACMRKLLITMNAMIKKNELCNY
jgi:transposase